MIVTWKVAQKQTTMSPITRALFDAAPDHGADGVTNWHVPQAHATPITTPEATRLKRSHKTKSVNITRAEAVKRMMQQGYTLPQICSKLRAFGVGFGESSIRKTHAALTAALSKRK